MNFITFGTFLKSKKKIYEHITGNLYERYMLQRYFWDIFLINKAIKKKNEIQKLHHKKDLRLYLNSYIFLKHNKKSKIFYEFGCTLLEKIHFFKFFNHLFRNHKLSLKKIFFSGNDLSDLFLFFAKNFYKDYNLLLSKKISFKNIRKSVFFSKGISILYAKDNYKILKKSIKLSECGSFDISVLKENKVLSLNTGYKLFFFSIRRLMKLIFNSDKIFYYRNFKKNNNKYYIELIYGKNRVLKNFIITHKKFRKLAKFEKNNLFKRLDKNIFNKLFF